MSGGSYNYAYQGVEVFVAELRGRYSDPMRRTLAEHLVKVAAAMRAVEWVDSGDFGPGDEHGPILACVFPNREMVADALRASILAAEVALDSLGVVK